MNFRLERFATIAALLLVCLAGLPAAAGQLNIRGGYTRSNSDFNFATIDTFPDTVVSTDYGSGGFVEGEYIFGSPLAGVNLQIGGGFSRISNSDNANPVNCDISGYLGLISDCWDSTSAQSSVAKFNVDILARFRPFGSGPALPEVLLGGTYVDIQENIYSQNLFAGGFENFVSRLTSTNGFGVKGGLEDRVELTPGFGLTGTLLASIVRGDRDFSVADREVFNRTVQTRFAALAQSDSPTVYIWEARLAFYNDLSFLGFNGKIEYGAKSEKIYNAFNTTNTVRSGNVGPLTYGSAHDDVGAWSLFAGVSVPIP